ncbi:uclacyanin 1-like [Quercus lobata]|uniref:Phytocyanin domain-containing protein n=1 Tax=Quercus lobata TaxID=97700 RepID=A0A7N2RC85_QUELO|nr:uclacyanin 1-like [Quercus lobata]
MRPGWAVKAILVIIITSILIRCVSATNHTVGGSSGWDLASNLQAWSSATTFHVGDFLVFIYTPVHDVLEVGKSDFEMCRVSHPLNAYRDGETVISLSSEGSRYFICGRHGYCDMGLKLQLQVLPSLNTTTATIAPAAGPSAHENPPPPQPSSSSTSPLSPINSNSSSSAAACCHVNSSRSLINWCSCFPFITTLPLLLLLSS